MRKLSLAALILLPQSALAHGTGAVHHHATTGTEFAMIAVLVVLTGLSLLALRWFSKGV